MAGYRKPGILIIDDCGMVLRNIKSMLQDDFDVSIAVSGKMALVRLKDYTPDLILLDYEMPEMNGRETFEAIRALDSCKDVPIVYLTSMDDRATIMELMQQFPAGYLLKPPKPQKLIETINGILDAQASASSRAAEA